MYDTERILLHFGICLRFKQASLKIKNKDVGEGVWGWWWGWGHRRKGRSIRGQY